MVRAYFRCHLQWIWLNDLSFACRMHHPFYFLTEMHGLVRLHVYEAEMISLCLHGSAERWRLIDVTAMPDGDPLTT